MNSQKFYAIQEIFLESAAVVDVHKFAWNEPGRKGALLQIFMREKDKITIQSRQTREVQSRFLGDTVCEKLLVFFSDIVMTHVGWVAYQQVRVNIIACESSEIAADHLQTVRRPQFLRQ